MAEQARRSWVVRGLGAVGAWFAKDRKRRFWVLVLFLAALVVRLHWNLEVHPLGEFLYSDMNGYSGRADAILKDPWSSREYDAFFPFGTTWLIAAIKWAFGKENFDAIGVVYAIFGAGIVGACYAIADRVMGHRVRWVAPFVGVFMVAYYPLISIGSYILSELPFSFFLTMSLLLLIRVVDEGRRLDAWLLGFTLGCGCLIRSQLVASIALIGLFWLVTRLFRKRKPYAKLDWKQLMRIAIPLALLLSMAAVRFHIHTGRYGLVSENSTINLIFGRCHNKGVYSRPDGKGHGTVRFSPPPLIQLEVHSKKNPDAVFRTRSIWADHPEPIEGVDGFKVDNLGCRKRKCRLPGSEIEYRGYIGDGKIHRKIVKACMERGGLERQAYFTVTHWVMLWRHNLMWPDQANPRPRPKETKKEGWRTLQERWGWIHRNFLVIPALLGLMFVFFPRRRPKEALVALNFWSLLVVAGVWLGGIRFRVPYDPVIILCAAFTAGFAWEQARKGLLWALGERPEGEAEAESASTEGETDESEAEAQAGGADEGEPPDEGQAEASEADSEPDSDSDSDEADSEPDSEPDSDSDEAGADSELGEAAKAKADSEPAEADAEPGEAEADEPEDEDEAEKT